MYSPRCPLPRRTGHAGGDRREEPGGKRQEGHPPLPPRPSLTSLARWGGAFQQTKQREATLPSTPAAPPRLSALLSRRHCGPRFLDCPNPCAASREVRAGRGGGDGVGGRELRSRSRVWLPSCSQGGHSKAPEPPEQRFPRAARPGKGGRSQDRAAAGGGACRAVALEASGGLVITSLWKPRHAPGRTRAPVRARASPATCSPARPPSVFS